MRVTTLIFWSQASWLLAAMLTACGGDSGSGSGVSSAQAQQTCLKVCNKEKECTPSLPLNCDQLCSQKGGSGGSTSTGTGTSNCDYNTLASKQSTCADGSCSDLESCLRDAMSAACGGGTGGANGSGGSTGTGASSSGTGASSSGTGGSGESSDSGASSGTGGSASGATDCSVCDQAAACCMQAGVGASCATSFSKATCDMEGSSVKPTIIQGCQTAIDEFKKAGLCN
jgi:hypothetical protein